MKKRHTKLLQLLSKEEYISGKEISEFLNVSIRTVRSDIRCLNENYLLDSQIQSNNRLGYKVIGNMSIFKSNNDMDFEHRAFLILQLLKTKNEWATYQEIGDSIWFSPQTIATDLLKISETIGRNNYNLTLKTEPFSGIQLVGCEMDKRLLLASFVTKNFATRQEFQNEITNLFQQWLSQNFITSVFHTLNEIINEYQIIVEDDAWSVLVSHLLIQQTYFSISPIPSHELQLSRNYEAFDETTLAKDILYRISNLPQEQIKEQEIQYLVLQLLGLKILKTNTRPSQKLDETVEQAILKVGNHYGYELLTDNRLLKGLKSHLEKMIVPLRFNVSIQNQFLTRIKSDYIQAYQMAAMFSELLNQKLGLSIPEEEIGYITLHIESSIERFNTLSIKIGLAHTQSEVISTLMKQKIEKNFHQVQVIDIYSWKNSDDLPEDISLIISSQPITIPHKKTLVVNEFLQSEDLLKIKQNTTPNVIKKYTDHEKFVYLHEDSKHSLLEKMVHHFHLQHHLDGILDRENLSTTEIGNKVAVPHPLFSTNEPQSSIYIGINNKEVHWGESSVKLVFLLILSEQDKLSYEYIYREIYLLIKHKSALKQLMEAQDYQDFVQFLNY